MVNKSKTASGKSEVGSRLLREVALALLAISYSLAPGFAQQPQAPAGTPLYSVNAKYVNGMAPGYWPTAGTGLVLNLSSGTAYCGNPPVPVSYPGGSLALTASATNYIYLDPANHCSPAAGTSAFAAGEIPIATVVTGASSITSISDARTWFAPQPCVTGSAGDLQCSSLGTNQNITLSPSGSGATVVTNLADRGGQVFNVKSYGAACDGSTNDATAIAAAITSASAVNGTVMIPAAECATDSAIVVPSGVTLEGASVSGSLIIPGASFPSSGSINGATPVIQLGDTTNGGDRTVLRDISIDCIQKAETIGIYAIGLNENSGLNHVNVGNCTNYPVYLDSNITATNGANNQNWFIDGLYIWGLANASTPGLFVDNTSGTGGATFHNIRNVTVGQAGESTCIQISDQIDGAISGLHFENCATGLLLDGSNVALNGLEAAATTGGTVIKIQNGAGNAWFNSFHGVYGTGSPTYVLDDTVFGITDASWFPSYVQGSSGSCTMSSATSCTATVRYGAHCTATDQGTGAIAGSCAIASGTLTVTAASSNSDTWAWSITN
jgi:Pectate lyase superfamily protein